MDERASTTLLLDLRDLRPSRRDEAAMRALASYG